MLVFRKIALAKPFARRLACSPALCGQVGSQRPSRCMHQESELSATSPRVVSPDPQGEVRRTNVRKLENCFRSRKAFCEAAGRNPSHITTVLANGSRTEIYRRNVGSRVARSIETALELPNLAIDKVGGVDEHLPELTRKHGGRPHQPSSALAATLNDAESGLPAASAQPPLKPLHQAAVQALEAALREGRLSDKLCAQLIADWSV
jgi:hypothetical protein